MTGTHSRREPWKIGSVLSVMGTLNGSRREVGQKFNSAAAGQGMRKVCPWLEQSWDAISKLLLAGLATQIHWEFYFLETQRKNQELISWYAYITPSSLSFIVIPPLFILFIMGKPLDSEWFCIQLSTLRWTLCDKHQGTYPYYNLIHCKKCKHLH